MCRSIQILLPTFIKIYFDYDARWAGKKMEILDMSGRIVLSKIISSQEEKIDVSRLTAGVYFIRAEKKMKNYTQNLLKL
jgi:hypothetical protein